MCKSKAVLSYFAKRNDKAAKLFYEACETINDFTAVYVEGFVEQKCAEYNNTDFVDAAEYDLSDGTEVKNVTVNPNPIMNTSSYTRKDGTKVKNKKRSDNLFNLSIPGVASRAGVFKSGDLRVIVYNPMKDELDFFFIPKSELGAPESDCPVKSSQRAKDGTRKISTTYNLKMDTYGKLEPYRVPTFSKMAKTKATPLTVANLKAIQNA